MKAKADGIDSHAEESRVPVQPKLCGKGLSISQDKTFGTNPFCRSRAAHRKPHPRGTKHHLWRLAAYQSAPMDGMSRAMLPGACAPSTRTATPCSRQTRHISAMGRTKAVAEVMWSRIASFVRGDSAAFKASTHRAGSGFGNGSATSMTCAPCRPAMYLAALA